MTRLFLDTNILARLLLGDNMEQGKKTTELLKSAKLGEVELHLSPEVFIELNYVLSKIYGIEKIQIIKEFKNILSYSFIHCQNSDILVNALILFENENISLEDAYYISFCLENNLEFYSFDKKALKIFKQENVA
ncbi:MAG: PIN domain-containing protein [bacterium]